MNSAHATIKQSHALLRGPMNSNALNRVGIIAATLHGAQQFGGECGAARQIRHALKASDVGDGHDAGHHRHANSREFTAFAPIKECGVVKK